MVFVKRKTQLKSEDLPMFVLLSKKEKNGQIGLEIEVESDKADVFPKELTVAKYWTYVKDGSLRGADNAEYVLKNPIDFDKADEAIDLLFKVFTDGKIPLAESNRTSVHVHINVLPFYINRVAALMALWFTVEDVLCHFSGEHRVGNLFALQAKDAPTVVRRCAEFVKAGGGGFSEGQHYAAMSPYAMLKHGSLEFRTLRGVTDPELMKTWVKVLKCLYDASDSYKDPTDIPLSFSYNGPMEFFRELFGADLAETIQKGCGLTDEQIRDSLYEGVRFAQDICYARDWKDFNPVRVVQDPFGRKAVKTKSAGSLAQMVEEVAAQGGHQFDWGNIQPNEAAQIVLNNVRRRRAPPPPAQVNNNPFAEWND